MILRLDILLVIILSKGYLLWFCSLHFASLALIGLFEYLSLVQKNVPPTAVEMENLRKKMFKMEVELTSASDKHQQE